MFGRKSSSNKNVVVKKSTINNRPTSVVKTVNINPNHKPINVNSKLRRFQRYFRSNYQFEKFASEFRVWAKSNKGKSATNVMLLMPDQMEYAGYEKQSGAGLGQKYHIIFTKTTDPYAKTLISIVRNAQKDATPNNVPFYFVVNGAQVHLSRLVMDKIIGLGSNDYNYSTISLI